MGRGRGGVIKFRRHLEKFHPRANFKMRSNPVPRGSNFGCFGVFRLNVAFSSTWSDLENQGHPPLKNVSFSSGRCNFSFKRHRSTDLIPTAIHPHFRPRPDLDDIVDCGFKMAAIKPELEITFER